MRWLPYLLLLTSVLVLMVVVPAAQAGTPVPRNEGDLERTTTLGDLLKPGEPGKVDRTNFHIIYVHGMRAHGGGQSAELRTALRKYQRWEPSSEVPSGERIPLAKPRSAFVGEIELWRKAEDWQASLPFIQRYAFRRGEQSLTVHEVNWWPLLFPLKCRMLLMREHDLAGSDPELLELCSGKRQGYHPWISPKEMEALSTKPPRSGGGARINAHLKRQFVDWGFADAVIALGPMQTLLRQAVDASFARVEASADPSDTVVVVTESLGSFVLLDAYDKGLPGVTATLKKSDYLFFFANQFALLELGRITLEPQKADRQTKVSDSKEGDGAIELHPANRSETLVSGSPLRALERWAGESKDSDEPPATPGPAQLTRPGPPKQVVAFNDPSDALTFDLPCIKGVNIINLYVRNTPSWLGLFALPGPAHRGGLENKHLLRWLLSPNKSDSSPPKCVDPAKQ